MLQITLKPSKKRLANLRHWCVLPVSWCGRLTIESLKPYEGLYENVDSANLVKGGYIEAPAGRVQVDNISFYLDTE